MDRIWGTGFATDVSGHRLFVDQNLAGGIDGTDVVALWPNGIQEAIATVIENAGIVPDVGWVATVRRAT